MLVVKSEHPWFDIVPELAKQVKNVYSKTSENLTFFTKLTFSVRFSLNSTKAYVVTIHWNRLGNTIPTNGHIIGVIREIRKIAFEIRIQE